MFLLPSLKTIFILTITSKIRIFLFIYVISLQQYQYLALLQFKSQQLQTRLISFFPSNPKKREKVSSPQIDQNHSLYPIRKRRLLVCSCRLGCTTVSVYSTIPPLLDPKISKLSQASNKSISRFLSLSTCLTIIYSFFSSSPAARMGTCRILMVLSDGGGCTIREETMRGFYCLSSGLGSWGEGRGVDWGSADEDWVGQRMGQRYTLHRNEVLCRRGGGGGSWLGGEEASTGSLLILRQTFSLSRANLVCCNVFARSPFMRKSLKRSSLSSFCICCEATFRCRTSLRPITNLSSSVESSLDGRQERLTVLRRPGKLVLFAIQPLQTRPPFAISPLTPRKQGIIQTQVQMGVGQSLIFLLVGNKMSRFEQTPHDRAERHRKHQFYKQMLDEQLSYKYNTSTEPLKLTAHYYPSSPPQHNQPPFPPTPPRRNPQNERIDQYLDQSEDVIRSLRDMRPKKNVQFIPQLNEYYPRPSYFSVVQAPLVHSEARTPRMRTIDGRNTPKKPPIKQDRNGSGKLLTEPNPEKTNKKNLRIKPMKNSKKSKAIRLSPQSKSKSNSKSKSKGKGKGKTKSKSPRSNSQDSLEERENKLREEEERQQERRRERESLGECLLQMSRYLRSQEEEQQRRSNRKEEAVQVDDPRLQQSKKQARMHELKLKALLSLRRIKHRGQDLVDTVQERGHPNQSQSRLPSSSQPQRQENKSITSTYNQPSPPSPPSKPTPKQELMQQQNEELMKLMVEHLELQHDKNEELTNCLRELTDYMRMQRNQILAIQGKRPEAERRGSPNISSPRIQEARLEEYPKQTVKQTASPYRTPSPNPQQPMEEEELTKQEEKLRQAFLRRLKKARMRGSMLYEKA